MLHHATLDSHYTAWSYKKEKTKMKSILKSSMERTKRCLLTLDFQEEKNEKHIEKLIKKNPKVPLNSRLTPI